MIRLFSSMSLFFSEHQALVFLLEHPGIRQLLHKLFGSVGTSVLGVTVKQQPADKDGSMDFPAWFSLFFISDIKIRKTEGTGKRKALFIRI